MLRSFFDSKHIGSGIDVWESNEGSISFIEGINDYEERLFSLESVPCTYISVNIDTSFVLVFYSDVSTSYCLTLRLSYES